MPFAIRHGPRTPVPTQNFVYILFDAFMIGVVEAGRRRVGRFACSLQTNLQKFRRLVFAINSNAGAETLENARNLNKNSHFVGTLRRF